MANPDPDSALARLRADPDYAARFAEVYGAGPISADKLTDALVAFQTRLETETRFDRFASGDRNTLTDQEVWGLHLFRTKARCANCHFGPLLTDDRFHNLKISFFGEKAQDLGRYQVIHLPDDVGRFRTPSLRHVGETAPYMHNGLFPTLECVITSTLAAAVRYGRGTEAKRQIRFIRLLRGRRPTSGRSVFPTKRKPPSPRSCVRFERAMRLPIVRPSRLRRSPSPA